MRILKIVVVSWVCALVATAIGSALVTGLAVLGAVISPEGFLTPRDIAQYFAANIVAVAVPACIALSSAIFTLARHPRNVLYRYGLSGVVAFASVGVGVAVFEPLLFELSHPIDFADLAARIELTNAFMRGLVLLPLSWPLSWVACAAALSLTQQNRE